MNECDFCGTPNIAYAGRYCSGDCEHLANCNDDGTCCS